MVGKDEADGDDNGDGDENEDQDPLDAIDMPVLLCLSLPTRSEECSGPRNNSIYYWTFRTVAVPSLLSLLCLA